MVMTNSAPYHSVRPPPGPNYAAVAATGGQSQPPCPAPHQLYGNNLHKPAHHNLNNNVHEARRKHVAKSFNNFYGGAYGNSIPNTPPPPRPSEPSERNRLAPCIQFAAKGSCAYGARCKYSHDLPRPPVNSSPSPQYLINLAPAATGTRYALPYWIHSLPKPAAIHHRESSSQAPLPPKKPHQQLLFKDAVLKQKSVCASEDQWVPPVKSKAMDERPELQGPFKPSCTNPERDHVNPPQQWGGNGRVYPVRYKSVDSGLLLAKKVSSKETNCVFYGEAPKPPPPGSGWQNFSTGYQQHFYYQPGEPQVMSTAYPIYSSQPFACSSKLSQSLSCQVDTFVEDLDVELVKLEQSQQDSIDQLQAAVQSLWTDAFIDVYGSNYTRLSLPMSDVDCVLSSRTLVEKSPSSILHKLAEVVRAKPWAKQVDLLGCAKIPVLKIIYCAGAGEQKVMLDLTCGHSPGHSGLSARDLIYSLQAEMPALRSLVLVLKAHLQCFGLSCAFTGGLSSYALVLLVIRFLQACGDEHHKSFNGSNERKYHGRRRRSLSENSLPLKQHDGDSGSRNNKWLYTFSRAGKVVWRTTIGSLLLLFLETYITFDYRRFGVTIENGGEFFALPTDKVTLEPELPITPFIADPIKKGRRIGNAFRMSEVVQAWLVLYQQLVSGASLAESIMKHGKAP